MKKEIINSALNNNSDCCTYCKKEIDSYNSLEINGINEIACNKCYDNLYMN